MTRSPTGSNWRSAVGHVGSRAIEAATRMRSVQETIEEIRQPLSREARLWPSYRAGGASGLGKDNDAREACRYGKG